MNIRKMPRGGIGVFLSDDDLEQYGIDTETERPQSMELHRMLFDVMENVRKQTDFDPYNGGQVVVEAMVVPGGMDLHINKIGTNIELPILPGAVSDVHTKRKTSPSRRRTISGGKRLSRSQFDAVRNIRVKNSGDFFAEGQFGNRALLDFMEKAGLIQPVEVQKHCNKMKEDNESVFVFDSFENTESALCHAEENTLKEGELYRNGSRYALVTKLKKNSIQYNVLSEFSYKQCSGSITAAHYKEAWKQVVCGDELVKMAEAVRGMQ